MRRTFVSLTVPGGAVLVIITALLHWNVLPLTTPPLAGYFRYTVLIAGVLLAWRFGSSHIFFAAVTLGLAASGLLYASAEGSGQAARNAIGLLLPINLALLAFGRVRGFSVSGSVSRVTALFVQSVAVIVICRPEQGIRLTWLEYPLLPDSLLGWTDLPQPILLVFLMALIMLLARYIQKGRAADAALFWAIAAAALAMRTGETAPGAGAYFATGGLILVVTLVETSYRLAYHDELTGLPSRRAFNDALHTLGSDYAIAIADVDHFKKFNDTYGHDTGDQVLRMVAARLARVSGGGQAFRCGGEEFALVFAGKSSREALCHLQAVKEAVASAVFMVRGPDRSERIRVERRRGKVNRRAGYGGPRPVGVTISIGVADSRIADDAQKVIRAADRALYAAKENGRNRVEMAAGRARIMEVRLKR